MLDGPLDEPPLDGSLDEPLLEDPLDKPPLDKKYLGHLIKYNHTSNVIIRQAIWRSG